MAKEIDRLHKIIGTMYNDLETAEYSLIGGEYRQQDNRQSLSYIDRLISVQRGYSRIYDYATKVMKENKQLKQELEELRQNPPKSKSSAGRHSKFTEEQKKDILEAYNGGRVSMGKLAKRYDCSKGLIHKIIREGVHK